MVKLQRIFQVDEKQSILHFEFGAIYSASDRLKRWYAVAKISSCSCFTVLPGPAWVLLSKICILFSRSLKSE